MDLRFCGARANKTILMGFAAKGKARGKLITKSPFSVIITLRLLVSVAGSVVVGLDQAESVPFMRFFVVCDFMLGEICP
jgi:hypothetical protein